MTIRRFARPYARAIMDVAGSPQKANEVRGELMTFAKALRGSPDLHDFFANPGVDMETKVSTTAKLASRMKVSELTAKALEILVRFHRINHIDAILAALTAYVHEALGVAIAEVRSAKSLSPDEMQQLADVLSRKVGRTIELDIRTDPTLLGGFVARIGSEIYDASVAGKIERFRESLS